MKTFVKVFSLLLSLLALDASSQSDYTVGWTISGIFRSGIVGLEYDLDVGTKFVSAHGVVIQPNGFKRPSTGSCYVTRNSGVICEMTHPAGKFILDLGEDLIGDIRVLNESGLVIETGLAIVNEVF